MLGLRFAETRPRSTRPGRDRLARCDADAGTYEISTSVVMVATAAYFDTSLEESRGPAQTRALWQSRQIATCVCASSPTSRCPVGQAFGRDHTAVMYAEKKIRGEMPHRREVFDQSGLTTRIRQRSSAEIPLFLWSPQTLVTVAPVVTSFAVETAVDNMGNSGEVRESQEQPAAVHSRPVSRPRSSPTDGKPSPHPSRALSL